MTLCLSHHFTKKLFSFFFLNEIDLTFLVQERFKITQPAFQLILSSIATATTSTTLTATIAIAATIKTATAIAQ